MPVRTESFSSFSRGRGKTCLLGLLVALALAPAAANAQIVWSGDFNSQNFLNYHVENNTNEVHFHHIPAYGRPIQYGGQHELHVGNGDLLSLESSHRRGSAYSAKFTIKNSTNGSEPNDCDPATGCANRRAQIQSVKSFTEQYNALPYHEERWLSFSVFLPSDFNIGGGAWKPVVWGLKPAGGPTTGWTSVNLDNSGWEIGHRVSKTEAIPLDDWWYSHRYTTFQPSATDGPQLLRDLPNEAASKAALGNLNLGGWTDFIFHFKTDTRDVVEGNDGFLNVYMRAGSGDWVHVLEILPMADFAFVPSWATSNPERVFDRSIGSLTGPGYGSNIGLYMPKEAVWGNAQNMVVYLDNYKVGDGRATFEMMTHDGSSFEGGTTQTTRPLPPLILTSP